MADKVYVTKDKLTAVADAIRTKGGTSASLTLDQMPAAVQAIPSGGGEDLLQHRISGDIQYQYENNKITVIRNSSFEEDGCLKHISFPKVTFIGDKAFRNTTKLDEPVIFPELTTLNPLAFQNSYITGFTAPKIKYAHENGLGGSHVRIIDLGREDKTDAIYIGNDFFAYSNVQTIIIRNNAVATLSKWCFCSYLANIYVPDDLVAEYKEATNWSSYADKFKPLSEYTA